MAPHDGIDGHGHDWTAPTDKLTRTGFGKFKAPKSPYDLWMDSQDIPIYRAIGISKVQDLPLQKWDLMGGNASFIQLFGTEGMWGCHIIEVPGAGALNPVRHIYEQQYFVVDGRGSTEVWEEGREDKVHVFEWQKGSLWSVPMNAKYRVVNASSSPALLLGGNTAPNVMNIYDNPDFIFNCPYNFRNRFDPDATDYYKPSDEILSDPIRGLAMTQTNIVPDIVDCELPLDNRRSPGYRRIEPHMTDNSFYLWIGQHETGRYSKGHAHGSAAVLICIKGKGYTYTWPARHGETPWKDGKADVVQRQDYEPVGLVSAAPMSGDWYHQHFGISAGPLRLTAWFGPHHPGRTVKRPGEDAIDYGAIDVRDGGSAIGYDVEDPYLRKEYEAYLAEVGAKSQMEPELYESKVN
jgi:hypothetical protein